MAKGSVIPSMRGIHLRAQLPLSLSLSPIPREYCNLLYLTLHTVILVSKLLNLCLTNPWTSNCVLALRSHLPSCWSDRPAFCPQIREMALHLTLSVPEAYFVECLLSSLPPPPTCNKYLWNEIARSTTSSGSSSSDVSLIETALQQTYRTYWRWVWWWAPLEPATNPQQCHHLTRKCRRERDGRQHSFLPPRDHYAQNRTPLLSFSHILFFKYIYIY